MVSDGQESAVGPGGGAGSGESPELYTAWDAGRVDAEREAWREVVDYNVRELKRFEYTLFGGLEEGLRGEVGLDERDDPENNDYLLSTLRFIVERMGGRLEVAAVFPGVRLPADVSGAGPLWERWEVDDEMIEWLTEWDYE